MFINKLEVLTVRVEAICFFRLLVKFVKVIKKSMRASEKVSPY